MTKYIIDTTSNETHFIVLKDNEVLCKIAKKCNTLENVKRFIGVMNIKEVR